MEGAVREGNGEQRPGRTAGGPEPGALSALLRALAEAPEVDRGAGWAGALHAGAVFGRFELLRELGRGGFGAVWEARDLQLGRTVAFKAIRAGQDAVRREELALREAEAAARLSHPNLLVLHDVGRAEPGPYLVFEHLRGRTLGDRMAEGPVPPAEAVRTALQVARGVAHAHRAGVIHRDLKPGNVFLTEDGTVKVLDFGLAHLFGHRRLEGGSYAAMAPEQARGAPEDERTDVFALGLLLFELLAGKRPFPRGDGGRALAGAAPAPALEVPGAPGLGALVARMLEKDPVRRPRDAGELVLPLEAALRELERSSEADAPRVHVRRRRTLRTAALVLAGILLGGLAAVAATWLRATPAARGRAAIAVADFQNRTGEPEMDALSGLLITSLEQSRRLSVMTRARLADLATQAGLPSGDLSDEKVGRTVGRRAGVRAVLLGTIRRLGSVYVLEVRAVAPDRDSALFSLREQAASHEAVLAAIDRLGDGARRGLEEGPQEIGARRVELARAVTGNLDAYQHYFRGVALFEEHDFNGAYQAFQRALALDPEMALAHVWLAFMAWYHTAGGEEVGPHLEAARRAAAAFPDKERRFAEALVAGFSGRRDEAGAILRRLADDYPDDKVVHHFAGFFAAVADQEAFYRRALALDPAYPWPLYSLILTLPLEGRGAETVALAERAVALRPGFAQRLNLARARGEVGDFEGGLAEIRRAIAAGPPRAQGAIILSGQLAGLGRLDEAIEAVRAWTGPDRTPADRVMALSQLAMIEALAGRRGAALRSVQALIGLRDDPDAREYLAGARTVGDAAALRAALETIPDPAPYRAPLFAWAGMGEKARELARGMRPDGEYEALLTRAGLARSEGRRDEAVQLLRQAAALQPNSADAWLLGTALAEAGRCAEAIPELDRLPRQLPLVFNQGLWLATRTPLALLGSARCEVALGRREAAREKVDRLLALWAGADPDLPALAEAKALRGELR